MYAHVEFMGRHKSLVVVIPNQANETDCESDGEQEEEMQGFIQEQEDKWEEYNEWLEGDMAFSTLNQSIRMELNNKEIPSETARNVSPFEFFVGIKIELSLLNSF